MKIVFFSNYFNHHQKPIADAFNAMEGVEYIFVATSPIPEFRIKLGYERLNADYLIDVTLSEENKRRAIELSKCADIAIFMAGRLEEYIVPRLLLKKLTFEVSERRFKLGYINMLSPNLIKHQIMYFRYGRKAPLYMLCCSAYAANDYNFLGAFVNRCYKWAYFTQVDNDLSIEVLNSESLASEIVPIMWCGRFIKWKHPELPVLMAAKLKAAGYKFVLNMYGEGIEQARVMAIAERLNVNDVVNFCGRQTNEVILAEMRKHKILLVTSDKREGWGAVVNEGLSNGCAVVGAASIGSVPYLVRDGVNGMIYQGMDLESMTEKVKYMLDYPKRLDNMRAEAVKTMQEVWSPAVAAERFLKLSESLLCGDDTPFKDGPCSMAKPYNSEYNEIKDI